MCGGALDIAQSAQLLGSTTPEHALGAGRKRRVACPQVTVDSQGLMKVTHMLSLAGVGADARGGHYASEADFQDSQRLAAQQRVGITQFLILSEQAAGEDEGDL